MNIPEGFGLAIATVYHEARGESKDGQKAVLKVILNRAEKRGWPLKDIVLSRKQFSCWNRGLDFPSVWIRDLPSFGEVSDNCFEALCEWEAGNRLWGATHYYAIKGMVGGRPPYWADKMKPICEIGGHRFLKE